MSATAFRWNWKCAGDGEKCGGLLHIGPTECCNPLYYCKPVNLLYSYCEVQIHRPPGWPPSGFPQSTRSRTSQISDTSCTTSTSTWPSDYVSSSDDYWTNSWITQSSGHEVSPSSVSWSSDENSASFPTDSYSYLSSASTASSESSESSEETSSYSTEPSTTEDETSTETDDVSGSTSSSESSESSEETSSYSTVPSTTEDETSTETDDVSGSTSSSESSASQSSSQTSSEATGNISSQISGQETSSGWSQSSTSYEGSSDTSSSDTPTSSYVILLALLQIKAQHPTKRPVLALLILPQGMARALLVLHPVMVPVPLLANRLIMVLVKQLLMVPALLALPIQP
ncbi:hypothetical protein KL918_005385 [Ogataea parapolymorpha]|nr:hypothetical protein KL918_005385 [Ogataea parapolymorpha]KAG7868484.1 hypothetical protein KL916_005260 [Ogataea parapolymorpha]